MTETRETAAVRRLKAATFNTHRAIGPDGRRSPQRIAKAIAAIDADVIGLQEVDWHHDSPGTASEFEILAGLEGYHAVAGSNLRDHRGHYGNLLLSRYPLERIQRLNLGIKDREPRSLIDATATTPHGPVRFLVTHLGLGWRERRRQAEKIACHVRDNETPAILLADANDYLPGMPTLRALVRRFRASPFRATFHARCPFLALDRIFWQGMSTAPTVKLHDTSQASDHLALSAQWDLSGSHN